MPVKFRRSSLKSRNSRKSRKSRKSFRRPRRGRRTVRRNRKNRMSRGKVKRGIRRKFMGGATTGTNLFSSTGGEEQIEQMFVDAANGNGPNNISDVQIYLKENPWHIFIICKTDGTTQSNGHDFEMYYKVRDEYKSYQIGENPSTNMLQFKAVNGQDLDTNVIYKTRGQINYDKIANYIYNHFRSQNHFT